MKNRIIHNVTRFQAIWRGYLYKQAYPVALRAAKATEAINLNARATLSTTETEFLEEWRQSALAPHSARSALWDKWLWSGEGQEDGPVTILNIGDHYEGLFNYDSPKEAIYSGEIDEIQYRGDCVEIKIKFHHDITAARDPKQCVNENSANTPTSS